LGALALDRKSYGERSPPMIRSSPMKTAISSITLCLLGVVVCSSAVSCSSSEERGASGAAPASASANPSSAPVASALATATATATAEVATPPHTSATPPPEQTPSVALQKETEAPIVVAFRPNGRAFAAGAGKKVSLIPIGGGEPRALPDHDRSVVAIAFSLKGDRLATVDQGGKVRIWDPSAGKLIAELPDAIAGEPRAIAFAPDGKLFAGAGSSATIWSVEKKKKICATEDSWIFDLTFTPDQGSLITTGSGQSARWDSATCAKKAEGSAQTGGTFGSWVAPGGKHVAAAAPDGHGLALYDGRSFKGIDVVAKSFGCHDHVGPVRFSRDGEVMLASGSYQWFRSIRLDSMKTIASYDVPRAGDVNQLVMFDDGERVLVVRGDKGELVSAVSKSIAYAIDLKGAQTFDIAWDMKHLLGVSKGTAHVWDTATGKLVKSYPLPGS
jgi:WD40 repeat protein